MITRMKECTHFLMLNPHLVAIEVSLCGFTMQTNIHTHTRRDTRKELKKFCIDSKQFAIEKTWEWESIANTAIWFIIFKIKLWILWSAVIAGLRAALLQIQMCEKIVELLSCAFDYITFILFCLHSMQKAAVHNGPTWMIGAHCTRAHRTRLTCFDCEKQNRKIQSADNRWNNCRQKCA